MIKTYEAVDVRLVDLVSLPPLLQDHAFHRCRIAGPAVVALLGDVALEDNQFGVDNVSDAIIEIVDNRTLHGVIGLRRVTFSECRFEGVGFALNSEQSLQFRLGTD